MRKVSKGVKHSVVRKLPYWVIAGDKSVVVAFVSVLAAQSTTLAIHFGVGPPTVGYHNGGSQRLGTLANHTQVAHQSVVVQIQQSCGSI